MAKGIAIPYGIYDLKGNGNEMLAPSVKKRIERDQEYWPKNIETRRLSAEY